MNRIAILLFLLLLTSCNKVKLASVSIDEKTALETLFQNVSVFDGESLLRNQDVLVKNGKIEALSITGMREFSGNPRIIDGSERTLLPGLVDSHIHLFSAGEKSGLPPSPEQIAEAFLFSGVTSGLVTAGFDEAPDLIKASEEGRQLSPHLFTAGPGLSPPGGHPIPLLRAMLPWPLSWIVSSRIPTASTQEEAKEKVREIKKKYNPNFFKIIYDDLPPGSPHLSREALNAAVSEAKAQGLRPIVHATSCKDSLEAVEAGADLLVHVPQKEICRSNQVEKLASSGVPVVTTLNLIAASRILAQSGPTDLERKTLDPRLWEPWQKNPAWELKGFSDVVDKDNERISRIAKANFQNLFLAGMRFFVGTDSGVHAVFPGTSLHREIHTLVNLGVPPLQVLKAVTSDPARFLDPTGSFGRIAPGVRADLLLVTGDVSQDIGNVSRIEAVYLEGKELSRHPL